MSSAGGGGRATDEIPEVEMDIMERPSEEPGRVGSKRVRDSSNGNGSYGFCGVTTAEEKPTLQPHDDDKYLKKAGNVNHVHMNSDGTSKLGVRYLRATHGLQTLPDSNALRLSSSPLGENLENKTKRATKVCTFYAEGRCKKGKSCTSLHEREGPGSDSRWSNGEKAGLLAPAGYGNPRGSEEESQVHLSNLKVPQFKDSVGSSKDELYRTLIHVYGEDDTMLAHLVDKQNSPSPGVSQGMPCRIDYSLTKKPTTPIDELVQIPVVHEKNHEPFMGRRSSLTAETYLDGRGTFPRLLDGRHLQFVADKGSSLSDSHVSRTYTLNSDHRYRSFDLAISSDPLQHSEKLSAFGGTTENLPNTHQEEHHPSHASYSSHSLTGFRNPGYATSDNSFGSPALRATSHLGMLSHHQLTPGIGKVGLHKYVDVDKGYGTSSHGLLASSSPQPSIVSAGSFSPIKDEVWVTSVPFVPSFDFPDIIAPSRSQYDPFLDCVDPPKVGSTSILKSSNISCSVSRQRRTQYVTTDKSLNCNDRLTRNVSAKGSNELACLIASDRGRSSSLDDNNRVTACDRKNDAASNNEKTRELRFRLAEHVKELVKPFWKEGKLSKDAHKLVVKKSVDKVLDSIEAHQVPTTEELITNYITASESKIEKLVKAYVDRHRTK